MRTIRPFCPTGSFESLKMVNHKAHLSFSQDGWILIFQGSPLCDYKKTFDEIMKVASFYKITLPNVTWNGDRAEWVTTNTIQEITA